MMKTIVIGCACLLALGCAEGPRTETPMFFEGSWEDAFEAARAEDKLVYVDFQTEWCGPCRQMEEEVYPDPDVRQFLDSHFVAISIDAEKGEGRRLAFRYRVRAYPTHLFFDHDGKLVARFVGGMSKDYFLDAVRASIAPTAQPTLTGISPSGDLAFPSFCAEYIDGSVPPSDSAVADHLARQADWFDEAAWTVVFWFGQSEDVWRFVSTNSNRLRTLFGDDDVRHKTESLARGELRRAISQRDPARRDTAIARYRRTSDERGVEFRIWNFRYEYCLGTDDWDGIVTMLEEAMADSRRSIDDGTLNNAAWSMYLRCDDEDALRWATATMKEATDRSPVYAFVDTYAALLFKTGRLKDAEVQARRAIDIGTKAKEDVASTRELLGKIRAALAKT
ncbi:MAG: thioredoxin fold domain-containing protein [Bacteroidetes bacterium]|nr:thioredoxin fold domain-containing protein [Bacteroidota bacterium]